VFLQAVDGGLDLVLVAGGGLTSKTITGFGLVARAGSGIKSAQDCVGKKIGVPGLGAFLHVTFRAWLKDSGVDYRKVNFVEAAFPQHADLLRGGSVDAVVSADPFMSRITESGAGYVASYYSTFLPENNQTIVHAAKREWVAKNPAAARAFREALVEAAAFMQQAEERRQGARRHRQVHQAAARGAGQGAGLAARPGRHRQAAGLLDRADEGAGHAQDPHRRCEADRQVISAPAPITARAALSASVARSPTSPTMQATPFLRFDGVTICLGGRDRPLPSTWRAASSSASSAPAAAARPRCCARPAGLVTPRRRGALQRREDDRALARSGLRVPGLRPRTAAVAHGGRQCEPRARSGRRARGRTRARIADVLGKVGLAKHAQKFPVQLSGGMQQRVQIARCLAQQPELMMMDEPFGALDALTRQSLQDELARLVRETGLTVLFVTHDLEEAIYLGDRVIALQANPGPGTAQPRANDRREDPAPARPAHDEGASGIPAVAA
jgi:ABC-type sugar transport system ATPase subunit